MKQCIISFLLFSTLFFFSQKVAGNNNDSIHIYNLIDEAEKIINSDRNEAIKKYEKALLKSEKIENYQLIIKICNSFHKIYLSVGDYQKCEFYLQKALKVSVEARIARQTSKQNNELAWLYVLKGEYVKAIEFANNALAYPKISDFQKAMAYNSLASAYQYLGNYVDALDYFYKGLKIHQKDNFQKGIAITYNNIAAIYNAQNDDDKALNLYLKSKEIFEKEKLKSALPQIYNNIASIYLKKNKLDSAEYYYKISYQLNVESENPVELARVASNMGHLYYKFKKKELSQKYLDEAISIFKKTNNGTDLSICYHQKGLLKIEQNQRDSAIFFMQKALQLAESSNSQEQKITVLEEFSNIYQKIGDFENAFLYQKKFETLKDSIFNIEKQIAINNIEAIYKIEQKEQKIELLEKEQKIKSNRYKALVAITLLAIILFSAFLYALYMRYKSSQQKVKLLKEAQRASLLEIEKKHLEIEKQDLENAKLKDELKFKERELATNAMHIIQVNEGNMKIVSELREIKKKLKIQDKKLITRLVNQITNSQSDSIWDEFEIRFTQVHENFYKKLNDKYPNLTPNEKKLCAFLKLNMTTKEISTITHQSPNSIRVARTRLRKKLELESDDSLIDFLGAI